MTLWLIMRGTGLVAMLLLTGTVILGIVSTAPHHGVTWPRWLSQAVHRDVSLLAVSLVAAHVATAVVDSHAGIDLLDVVLPFRTDFRPTWLGLGTLSVDLLLAVLLSSTVRLRLGGRAWRRVHWLAYAAWPLALVHGLGSGTDVRQPLVVAAAVACTVGVLLVLCWRATVDATPMRIASLVILLALTGAVAGWAVQGPLAPGWSRRAMPVNAGSP